MYNDPSRSETRGRKSKLSWRDLRAAEMILWRCGQEGRALTWQDLAIEAGLDVSGRTLQRHMVHMGYRRCLACRKGWVTAEVAAGRVEFATRMLAKYPDPEDWYHVRFSDEVHLGYGPQGRIYVTRKPGEVTCPDCVQREHEPSKKDEKKVHAWGAVSNGFQSPLHFYKTGKDNGAMNCWILQPCPSTVTEGGMTHRHVVAYSPLIDASVFPHPR